jgi:site-specific DNA-methyltransferase (adenine-specific)
LVYSKGVFKLERTKEEKAGARADTIDKKEFVELTKSVWRFPTVSAKRIGHPAPFPVELPRRCIEMYTFAGDVVLDPFLGSGQTAIAALQTGRRYIGVDLSEEYCELAGQRIAEAENATDRTEDESPAAVDLEIET